ncbi:MAG: trigger factor [Planctomycetota bacterium]
MAEDDIAGSQVDEENTATDETEDEKDLKGILAKVVDVAIADAGVLRKTLTIAVPRDSLDAELDKDYKELISDATVPGFRRGRAPRRLVEKRFGQEVGEQVQSRIVSNAYMAAIEKEDLKVLGDPLVWVEVEEKKGKGEEPEKKEMLLDMPSALRYLKLPEEGDLTFRCEVEIKPEFELPELEGVEIEKPRIEITDEDVQIQIDRMLARSGSWVPVPAGEVQVDDLLVCDMKMSVDGKEAKTQENLQLAARAQLVEGTMLEDLGDVMKGAKVGDTRQLEGELADDHEEEALRGKKAQFDLTVNEIKRLELPPLDEAYLTGMGFEGKDAEKEYRTWVKERMEGQLEAEIKRGLRNQVRKHLVDSTKLDLPEGLSSRQTERAVHRRMIELQRRGVPAAEVEKHADELRTGAREEAIEELKLHFILEEIAEKLEIEVTEEEINGQIAAMAQTYNRRFDRVRDELAKDNGIESLYLEIRDEKCIDRILEKAKITETTPEVKPKKKTPKKSAKKTSPEKAEAAEGETQSKSAKAKPKRKPPPKG